MRKRSNKRIYRRRKRILLSALACAVALATTCSLILPAVATDAYAAHTGPGTVLERTVEAPALAEPTEAAVQTAEPPAAPEPTQEEIVDAAVEEILSGTETEPPAEPSTEEEPEPGEEEPAEPSHAPGADPYEEGTVVDPTDLPEVSPEADPEESPAASPEVSPEASPGESPEADPEESPEPSEELESDPTADVETAADWSAMFRGFEFGDINSENLLSVARSQIGYAESEKNFIIQDDKTYGYTRYGAWYGNAYADWCAAFVSFCLNYAGISRDEIPYGASCPRWVAELNDRRMFTYVGSGYVPEPGDIIFFEQDGDSSADHVGIVEKVDLQAGKLTTIEGNTPANTVRRNEYRTDDSRIYGYGLLPAKMTAQQFSAMADDEVWVGVDAEEGALPAGTAMHVSRVTDESVLAEIRSAAGGASAGIHAVKISFADYYGREIEPKQPVKAALSSDLLIDADVTVVSCSGGAEVVSALFSGSYALFDLTRSGIVAAAASARYAELTLVAEGDDYTVTVICGADARIPGDAVLQVSEIPEGTPEYENYRTMAAGAVETDGEKLSFARFFDITILVNGQEVEPQAPVQVQIDYDRPQETGEDDSVSALHFGEEGTQVLDVKTQGTPEQLESVAFEAEGFSVYGVVGTETITTRYITAEGETYEITVTYSAEAGIPAGAALQAEELTDEDERYDSYVNDAADAMQTEASEFRYIKLLDISITDAAGKKIQPSAPVDVQIRLLDREVPEEAEAARIVHFGQETELLESAAAGDTVTFRTEGFSVYAVVTVDPADPEGLDGKSFGVIHTGGDNTNPTGTGLLSETNTNSLKGKTMTVRVDPVGRQDKVYVAGNSDIAMWTFNKVADNKYNITTVVNGTLKYLQIRSDGVYLVDADSVDDACTITVGRNSAGKYKFSNSNGSMRLNGGNFVRAAANSNDSNTWMNLAELSNLNDDDFVVYTAQKVSVSGSTTDTPSETSVPLGDGQFADYDVNDGDLIILYTRIWNGTKYDYYTIDHDGMLIKAYESGNTISWVGSKVNTMLWRFTEYHYDDGSPNYYYDLQNDYSGKYIAPQVSGITFLSDDTIGLNLNGRRYLEYYTTVLAWDDPYYDYASLKIDDANMQLVSAPMTRADDFYFAKMTVETEEEVSTVATIDHEPFGITLKMQDFGNVNSSSGRSREMDGVLGSTPYNQWAGTKNLLTKNMDGDYPVATASGTSLGQLFNNTMSVNQSFIVSTYNETGYFEYDSTKNFAHLITSTADNWYGRPTPGGGTYQVGDFVIYDQLGTSNEGSKPTLEHGQFFPYNDIVQWVQAKDEDGNPILDDNGNPVLEPKLVRASTKYHNDRDIYANPLSSLDPRKGENLYEIPYNSSHALPYVDHFFGLEMSASFMMNESGKDAWGHDLIFEFSGDDDFWLYVDGMLVLDLGGIHSALNGSINFKTGQIVENGTAKTLRQCYRAAYVQAHPNASEDEINNWLNGYFVDDGSNTGTVFKDYSGHTMRMFYLERGAGASNIHMRFNLAPYTAGEVQLEKKVSGTENLDAEFPFQLWYENLGWLRADESSSVTDVQTGEPIRYEPEVTVDGMTYRDVFFLKLGQTASFKLPGENTNYYVKECMLDSPATYDWVRINDAPNDGTRPTPDIYDGEALRQDLHPGENVTIPEDVDTDLKDFISTIDTVSGRKKVIYENHVSPNALQSLNITKRLWQEASMQNEIFSGDGPDADNTEFTFRIYIGRENGQYAIYNTGMYYIKNPEGEYCYFRNGRFVSTGKTEFSAIDENDVPPDPWKTPQEQCTFYASPGGAIERIRAGYTIEIPGLLSGTPFMVAERDGETPTGYHRLGYTFTGGPYVDGSPESETDPKESGYVIHGEIASGVSDQTVSVHNQHGYGLKLEKVWSDAAFMESHDDVYFAVYRKGSYGAPIENTVRVLEDPKTTINWFFRELDPDTTLNDYEVYEVELSGDGITVDPATGIVSGYDSLTRKEQDSTIEIGGTSSEHAYSVNYTYTVGYSREELTAAQIADNVNSRTDTVTNSRPGIRVIKTDRDGNPLSGAEFVLTDGGGKHKTFISDDSGLIAVAYLEAETTYTLRETVAPYGYQALIDSITIRVDAEGIVYVNGSDTAPEGAHYTILQVPQTEQSPDNMPTITIENKDAPLQARKVDAYSGSPIPGAKFALYKEVFETGAGGLPDLNYPMPNYTPIPGYESLVTDANGVIPGIVLKNSENPDGLTPGVYYLREEETPSGYKPLGVDIRITLSATGQITVQSAKSPPPSGGHWTIGEMPADVAVFDGDSVLLTVKNTPKDPIHILKLEEGTTNPLQGVAFELYGVDSVNTETAQPKPGAVPIYADVTDEDGILTLYGLELGENTSFYLFETQTLDGYNPLSGPVIITTVNYGENVTASLGGVPLNCRRTGISGPDDPRKVWEITVYNSAGAEIPKTGGPGTRLSTFGGLALILAAALIYGLRLRRGKKRARSHA